LLFYASNSVIHSKGNFSFWSFITPFFSAYVNIYRYIHILATCPPRVRPSYYWRCTAPKDRTHGNPISLPK